MPGCAAWSKWTRDNSVVWEGCVIFAWQFMPLWQRGKCDAASLPAACCPWAVAGKQAARTEVLHEHRAGLIAGAW